MVTKGDGKTRINESEPSLRVELNNSSTCCYLAGETVKGRVVVRSTNEKLTGATVQLRGVFVLKKSSDDDSAKILSRHRTIPYLVVDRFLDESVSFSGEGEQFLEGERVHTYPFQFVIPANLPSSYDSKWGWVKYGVTGEVYKEDCPKPLIKRQYITVIAPVDLNEVDGSGDSVHVWDIKGGNIFAGRTGDIAFSLKMPQGSGFVVGDAVDLNIEVVNDSNMKITGMKAWIHQVLTCFNGSKDISKSSIVAQVTGPEIDARNHKIWKPDKFVIPQLPTTTFEDNCGVVDIQYFLYFKMKVSGFTKPLSATIPLVIGTVPSEHFASKTATPANPTVNNNT